MNAAQIMERLLDGETISCGNGRHYAIRRGHLVYEYDDVPITVPVDGFPNVIEQIRPDFIDMAELTYDSIREWVRYHLECWRR